LIFKDNASFHIGFVGFFCTICFSSFIFFSSPSPLVSSELFPFALFFTFPFPNYQFCLLPFMLFSPTLPHLFCVVISHTGILGFFVFVLFFNFLLHASLPTLITQLSSHFVRLALSHLTSHLIFPNKDAVDATHVLSLPSFATRVLSLPLSHLFLTQIQLVKLTFFCFIFLLHVGTHHFLCNSPPLYCHTPTIW
jgi:hypothetical protein